MNFSFFLEWLHNLLSKLVHMWEWKGTRNSYKLRYSSANRPMVTLLIMGPVMFWFLWSQCLTLSGWSKFLVKIDEIFYDCLLLLFLFPSPTLVANNTYENFVWVTKCALFSWQQILDYTVSEHRLDFSYRFPLAWAFCVIKNYSVYLQLFILHKN